MKYLGWPGDKYGSSSLPSAQTSIQLRSFQRGAGGAESPVEVSVDGGSSVLVAEFSAKREVSFFFFSLPASISHYLSLLQQKITPSVLKVEILTHWYLKIDRGTLVLPHLILLLAGVKASAEKIPENNFFFSTKMYSSDCEGLKDHQHLTNQIYLPKEHVRPGIKSSPQPPLLNLFLHLVLVSLCFRGCSFLISVLSLPSCEWQVSHTRPWDHLWCMPW